MFIEPPAVGHSPIGSGWIEVITGCMFSGKTEELIRRLNRALIAKMTIGIFKPEVDKRYHKEYVVSHNASQIKATPVAQASEILKLAGAASVIGIDEAQFFDDDIVQVCNTLANNGKRIIVAGLNLDFEGKPFGPMPALMCVAEFVTKLHAICAVTGELASFTYRIAPSTKKILIGDKQDYEARSRKAFLLGTNAVEKT